MLASHRHRLLTLAVLVGCVILYGLIGAIGAQPAGAFGINPESHPQPLSPVTVLSATTTPDADAQETGSVTLSWVTCSEAAGYNIYRWDGEQYESVDELDQPEGDVASRLLNKPGRFAAM